MAMACHVILQGHVIKGSRGRSWEPLLASHQPAKFGGQRHSGSGDMFLVVEKQVSTNSLDSTITIFSKGHDKSCSFIRNLMMMK